jgi:hypothetical protein
LSGDFDADSDAFEELWCECFDGAVLAFWDAGASAVQCVAGCFDRVQIVVFAFAAAAGPVGPVDLRDHDAGFGEVAGQAAP